MCVCFFDTNTVVKNHLKERTKQKQNKNLLKKICIYYPILTKIFVYISLPFFFLSTKKFYTFCQTTLSITKIIIIPIHWLNSERKKCYPELCSTKLTNQTETETEKLINRKQNSNRTTTTTHKNTHTNTPIAKR